MQQLRAWRLPYMRDLNPRGKLAFLYVHTNFDPVILEDMSTETGLEASECRTWLQLFINQGQIRAEQIAEGQLL